MSSCQLKDFTEVAGGHVFRESRDLRVRQRIKHKMDYFKKQHGNVMCVGCGRCTEVCPAGISIQKIWEDLR